MPGWFAPWCLATTEPIAGYMSPAGLSRGSASQVGRLEDLVRLVVAVPAVHRADDRELVEHRRLLRQVLAERDAGQPGGDDAEGAAVLERAVGLGVPGVDLAGAAGHPEQDDALFPRIGRPASDARARHRSRSGRLSPARPASPALSMLRRLATTRPSRSVGLRPAKACGCECRALLGSLMGPPSWWVLGGVSASSRALVDVGGRGVVTHDPTAGVPAWPARRGAGPASPAGSCPDRSAGLALDNPDTWM